MKYKLVTDPETYVKDGTIYQTKMSKAAESKDFSAFYKLDSHKNKKYIDVCSGKIETFNYHVFYEPCTKKIIG